MRFDAFALLTSIGRYIHGLNYHTEDNQFLPNFASLSEWRSSVPLVPGVVLDAPGVTRSWPSRSRLINSPWVHFNHTTNLARSRIDVGLQLQGPPQSFYSKFAGSPLRYSYRR